MLKKAMPIVYITLGTLLSELSRVFMDIAGTLPTGP